MYAQIARISAFCLVALGSLGLDASHGAVMPELCGCQAAPDAKAVLLGINGTVFVSQLDGMRPAQVDAGVSLPARLLTGPQSSTTIKIGQACNVTVPERQSVRIEMRDGAWCVRAEAAGPRLPSQSAAQSPLPISILGTIAASSVVISISEKDQRVSR